MVGLRKTLQASIKEIEEAIRKAEEGSCGELVVVVCRIAGTYSWQEAIFSFLTALTTFSLSWWKWQGVAPGPTGRWDTGPIVVFHLGYALISLVLGFLLGQLIARFFPKLLAAFTSKRSMRRHAERAAALAFRRYRISETRRNTGVMIFIAELEQTVVVMGDDHISDNITQHDWEAIRDAILEGIRARKPVEGLISGVGLAGDLLRKHCPQMDGDGDELPNRLYFR